MTTILVVEDELSIARLLEDVLTDEGYVVLVAGNGKLGIEIALKEMPALILTDYMMPIMDGAALILGIANSGALRRVPVIMMSSMPEETVAERCSGYAAFVRKPFLLQEIIGVVNEFTKASA